MNKKISHILTVQFDEDENSKTYLYFKDECDVFEAIDKMATKFQKLKFSKKEGMNNAMIKYMRQIEDLKVLDFIEEENMYKEKSKEEIMKGIKEYVDSNYE